MPRFRIGSMMVLVAIAALNFAAIRVASNYREPTRDLLVTGALPMANVLVVGLLMGCHYRQSRRFLWGLEVFGSIVTDGPAHGHGPFAALAVVVLTVEGAAVRRGRLVLGHLNRWRLAPGHSWHVLSSGLELDLVKPTRPDHVASRTKVGVVR